MKPLLVLLVLALLLAALFQAVPALSQTEFPVVCQGGGLPDA